MEIELSQLKEHFEAFLEATEESRTLAERDRDYRDHKQWTTEEAEALKARGQAPVVINRIAPKVDFLTGYERSRRSDPKAFPRTPMHEQDADAITDALRYVADNVDFDMVASESFEQLLVEGVEGCIIEVEAKKEDYSIKVTPILWDRMYWDPHSRHRDFADCKYKGIVLWLDKEDVKEMFPDSAEEIDGMFMTSTDTADGTTFEDRPLWIDRKRKRIRVCQHYFIHKGQWHVAFFTDGVFLMEPKPSPYLDDEGNPECPIELQSVYVDRDNNRYGFVRGLIDIQDEINHRRSKALHLLSVRQTVGERGAVEDVAEAKTELSKPNGHVEITPGMRFEILPTSDMAQAQFSLLAEAKGEIDQMGANAALAGTEDRNMSGRAMLARQQSGLTELGPLFDSHRAWKKRVYRQIWNRIRQFWTAEKWIRVTDDEKNMKWVGLNQPVTYAEKIQQEYGQIPPNLIMDPRLTQVAEVRNQVSEIMVDIILDEGPDMITIQQEQFEVLANLAQMYGPQAVPFEAMVELSTIRNKEKFLERVKGNAEQQAAAAQQQQMVQQVQMAQVEADLAEKSANAQYKQAQTAKTMVEAQQTELENQLMMLQPIVPTVSI